MLKTSFPGEGKNWFFIKTCMHKLEESNWLQDLKKSLLGEISNKVSAASRGHFYYFATKGERFALEF